MDTSGAGSNGTLTNGAAYSSADRALTFDGTNDYVVGTLNNPAENWVHSFSFWMKLNVDQSTIGNSRMDPVQMGSTAATSKYSAIDVHGTVINWYFYSNDVSFPISGIKAGEWNHLTFAYQGGGTNSYRHAYLNGTEVTMTTSLSGGSALNIDANASVALGIDFVRPGAYLNGSISNFKVWSGVALTADEVAAEYALGRTGKALSVIDTAVCLGGTAPRAQLDVRGRRRFDGKLAIGYYGSSDKEALAPLDVRGDFIQSSANGTVSTAARFGSSDGTLHVSSVKTSTGAETIALQTTIDNKTMDYNIENSWSYGTDARHALCLQPYKGNVGINDTFPLQIIREWIAVLQSDGYWAEVYSIKYNELECTTRILALISQLRPQKYEKIIFLPRTTHQTIELRPMRNGRMRLKLQTW